MIEESGVAVHPYDVATMQGIDSQMAYLADKPEIAAALGESAVRFYDDAGSRMHRINHRTTLAMAYLQANRVDAAMDVLAQIDALEPREHYWQKPSRLAIEALCELRLGRMNEALALWRRALSISKKGGCVGTYHTIRAWAPQLCELALQHDIETDHVRELILHYEWSPPSSDIDRWPWPIKLVTMGQFSVLLHEVPVQFGRKAPRKLMLLLRTLIAFGGKQVPEQRLIDALWADQDGGAAYGALAVAIRRLRDLFQSDASIEHIDGKVSLDAGQVWVDAHAFERLSNTADDVHSRARALALYKSNFLADEASERWLVPYRERLRAKFVRLVKEQGMALEAVQAWSDAEQCYTKGLDADDLVESFYQGLMRCQAGLGRRAEALGTFRRMRQVLSVILGIQPSSESEALYRGLSPSNHE